MNPLISIDGLLGWLAVTLPIAILLVIALTVLLSARPRKQRDDRIALDAHGEGHGAPASLPLTAALEAHAILDTDRIVKAVGGDGIEVAASESTGLVQVEPGSAIAAEIADAESAGDRVRLMQLYLKLALFEREAGDIEAAKGSLRKLIMIASETGDPVPHAQGRLELGDIAQSQGDLTTACEHWQMARALFDQAARADESREAEARMQAQGCPTDWVLTDF